MTHDATTSPSDTAAHDGPRTDRRRGWLIALGAAVALLAVSVFAQAAAGYDGGPLPTERDHVEIECGGYDASGALVHPEAAEIDRAPLSTDGTPEIPAICGGYTEDGTFIGDD